MKETRGLKNWLKRDRYMINWVIVNAKRHGIHFFNEYNLPLKLPDQTTPKQEIEKNREIILNTLETLSKRDLSGYTIVKDLRAAWSNKKFSENPSKVTTSLTLKSDTYKKLKSLSQGSTNRSVIEQLILDAASYKEDICLEQEKKLKRKIHQIDPVTELKLNSKIEKLQNEKAHQKQIMLSMLEEIIQYEEIAEKQNLIIKNSLSSEQARIREKANERLKGLLKT